MKSPSANPAHEDQKLYKTLYIKQQSILQAPRQAVEAELRLPEGGIDIDGQYSPFAHAAFFC